MKWRVSRKVKMNTFELKDLDQAFWDKVVFIQIMHSSGLGGPGMILLITNDKKVYVLDVTDLPFSEYELEKLNVLLKCHRVDSVPGRYSVYEAESKGFKYSKKGSVLLKKEYFEKYEEKWQEAHDAKFNFVYEPDIMGQVLGVDKLEKYNLVQALKRQEEEQRAYEASKEKHEKKKLTEKYFEWKPLYMNNRYSEGFPEKGYYCLLLRKHEGKIYGSRFSIVYQREQIHPFEYSLNAPIQQYIVFEKKYGVIDGRMSFTDSKDTSHISIEYAELWDELNDCDLNDNGTFERALPTLEEAKKYVMALADRACFNIDNIIDTSDKKLLEKYEYENIKFKYDTILEFGKKYKEIFQIVAEYEYPSHSGGDEYLVKELVDKVGIDKKMAVKMLTFIPYILLPKNQRKSRELLEKNEKQYQVK